MRHTVTEVVKAHSGPKSTDFFWVVATWEWNNGFNLVSTRRATPDEIENRSFNKAS